MLSVKTVLNQFFFIEAIQHEICIFWHSCCENHYFIKLGELFNEVVSVRPYEEGRLTVHFLVVDEGFIHV